MIDRFHLTPAQIAELTDRQIAELYFHPRDEDGQIVPKKTPREESGLVFELQQVDKLLLMGLIDYAKAQELRADLEDMERKKCRPPKP